MASLDYSKVSPTEKLVQLLTLLHAPTSYESHGRQNDISILYALNEVDTSILSPELQAAVQRFVQRIDIGNAIRSAGTLADQDETIKQLQTDPDVIEVRQGLENSSPELKNALEKFLLVEWIGQFEIYFRALQLAITEVGDIDSYEETPEWEAKLEKVVECARDIDRVFWMISAIQNTDFIVEILVFIGHDFRGKANVDMIGAVRHIQLIGLDNGATLYKKAVKGLAVARNSLQTQLALLGARNEVRAPQLKDMEEMVAAIAIRFGYKVQVLNEPTVVTDLEDGVMGIYLDPSVLEMVQIDVAFFQNVILQTVKNTARIQYLKAADKFRKTTSREDQKSWRGELDPRLERKGVLISLDANPDRSRVNLRICDQAVGLSYDAILGTLREEAKICRDKGELSLVERMILDPEGIDQVPAIALYHQLIARGRTMTAGGTGLGLAATSLLANLNGGYLSMGNSTFNTGAVVSITFPVPQQGRMSPDGERNDRIAALNALADRILAVNEMGEPVEAAITAVLHPTALVYDEDQEVLLAVYETAQVNQAREHFGRRLDDTADTSLAAYFELLRRGAVIPPTPTHNEARV